MPLYSVMELKCDTCGFSTRARIQVDVLNHKKQAPRLEAACEPTDPTTRFIIDPFDRDPANWTVRPGYPDVVLCPRCSWKETHGDDGRPRAA